MFSALAQTRLLFKAGLCSRQASIIESKTTGDQTVLDYMWEPHTELSKQAEYGRALAMLVDCTVTDLSLVLDLVCVAMCQLPHKLFSPSPWLALNAGLY